MPPTLQQVREKWKQVTGNGQPAETVHASAIPAAMVTNVPEWDSYLRHLQAKLEEAQAAADNWKDKLATAFKPEEQLQAQCSYFSCQARAMTIKELMELPHQLKEQFSEMPKES